MTKLEQTLIAVLILILIAAGLVFYGYHIKSADDARAVAKQKQEQQDKINQLTASNVTLAVNSASTAAKAKTMQQQITTQSSKERIVYVHIKSTTQNPTPAPEAITSPVFVSIGAQWLFNSSFGLPSISGKPSAESAELPSLTTVSDYETTTVNNAVACYQNQQGLIQTEATLLELQKIGIIKFK